MTPVTITLPTAGLCADRYEIEATPEGITIEQGLVDDDGFLALRCGSVTILPQALGRIIKTLQKAQQEFAHV